MLKQWLIKKTLPDWVIPVLLLALTLVSFGLFLPKMGLYWDDWSKTLVNRLYGFSGYWDYYAYDRPLSGWTHIVFLSIFGDRPIYWHGLMLVLRWLTAVNLWWLLRLVWPNVPTRAAIAAAIFAVLPVFEQQAVAVTFHQQWLQYVLVSFSMVAMIKSIHSPHRARLWMLLALTTMALELTVTEYFIGLELLRLPLIFLVSQDRVEKGWKKAGLLLRRITPYLLVIGFFVVYRIFFFELVESDSFGKAFLTALKADPIAAIKTLWNGGWRDIAYLTFFNWGKLLPVDQLTKLMTPGDKLAWLGGAGAAFLSVFILSKVEFSKAEEENAQPSFGSFSLAVFALVLGLAPGWYIGLNILTDEHSDRIAIPALFGVSLLMAVLIEWLQSSRFKQALVVGLIVFFSVAGNIRLTNSFRWDWDSQRDYFWQLHWRMPSIDNGTALVTLKEPFEFSALFSTSSAINLMYPQEQAGYQLGYWLYSLTPRYNINNLPRPYHATLSTRFRSLNFKGGTPATVMVYWDPAQTNCVWVLGPQDRNDPGIPELMRLAVESSNLGRIGGEITPGYPPRDLFGPEPSEQEWCYFFEKGSLAVQFEEWEQAEDLLRQARDAGYSPADNAANIGHEWLPFLRTLIHTQKWVDAKNLTLEIAEADRRYEQYVCQIWGEDRSYNITPERLEIEAELASRLSCVIQ